MYIDDNNLRSHLIKLLKTKTRNQIVKEIHNHGLKMHQYSIDKFLQGKPVSLETVKKIDNYVYRNDKLPYNY
jgi:hypothetical protein